MQKDQAGKDVQQVRMMKDREGNKSMLKRLKEYSEKLLDEGNKMTDGA